MRRQLKEPSAHLQGRVGGTLLRATVDISILPVAEPVYRIRIVLRDTHISVVDGAREAKTMALLGGKVVISAGVRCARGVITGSLVVRDMPRLVIWPQSPYSVNAGHQPSRNVQMLEPCVFALNLLTHAVGGWAPKARLE